MNLFRPLLFTLTASLSGGFTPLALSAECQLNLSQPVLDFGLMNRAVRLDASADRQLGERRLSLTLSCAQPTDMTVFYRAIAATAERFRFTERGHYQIRLRDAVLDGQSVEVGLVAGAGQAPTLIASSLTWRPEHGIVPIRSGVAVQGRSFSVQLEVTAWAQEQALQVKDAVEWETTGLFNAVATGRSRTTSLRARFAPAACTPTLSNGGRVDFGKLSRHDLNPDKSTRLPGKSLNLRVSCDAPSHFALRMQDNREGSATVASEIYYGLGLDNRANRIGLYSLNFDPAQASADNVARLHRTDSTTAGKAWSPASSTPIPIGKNSYLGFTDRAGGTAGPVALQNFSASVTVDAVIAPTASLDLSSEVRLDGAATIEIVYL